MTFLCVRLHVKIAFHESLGFVIRKYSLHEAVTSMPAKYIEEIANRIVSKRTVDKQTYADP